MDYWDELTKKIHDIVEENSDIYCDWDEEIAPKLKQMLETELDSIVRGKLAFNPKPDEKT